jgi:hypothetical protein
VAGPFDLINRIARATRVTPPIGRCPVCHEDIRESDESLSIRGGLRVHRACASYRMRQRSRRA